MGNYADGPLRLTSCFPPEKKGSATRAATRRAVRVAWAFVSQALAPGSSDTLRKLRDPANRLQAPAASSDSSYRPGRGNSFRCPCIRYMNNIGSNACWRILLDDQADCTLLHRAAEQLARVQMPAPLVGLRVLRYHHPSSQLSDPAADDHGTQAQRSRAACGPLLAAVQASQLTLGFGRFGLCSAAAGRHAVYYRPAGPKLSQQFVLASRRSPPTFCTSRCSRLPRPRLGCPRAAATCAHGGPRRARAPRWGPADSYQ